MSRQFSAAGRATDKQVRYALMLLAQAGYSTKWMNAEYRKLGATMRERSGPVVDWLANKNVAQISSLIDELKS